MATLEARLVAIIQRIRDQFNTIKPRLVPTGGLNGQALVKNSEVDNSVYWADLPELVPAWSVSDTGTGSSQEITLPYSSLLATQVLVFVEGLVQSTATYSITADKLTITAPATAKIVVRSLPVLTSLAGPTTSALVSPAITSSSSSARTLTVEPATWNVGGTSTLQWKRSGVPISGATSTTLTLTDADLDTVITVEETLDGVIATSNSLVPTRVMLTFGQSNDLGARNNINELPADYVTADTNFKIWNVADQTIKTLVPGTMELQPGLSYIDPAYPNTVGPLGQFIKFFRTEHAPTVVVHAFNYVIGGSRFTDAGSLGRAANWTLSLTDGAWAGFKTEWANYCTAANAQGRAPYVVQVNTALGYNSAENSTESAAYQSDMSGLISAIRSRVAGNAKVVIERASSAVTGFGFLNAIRDAQAAIVLADPSRVEMVNTDGAKIGSADAIHFAASTFMFTGEARYYHLANKWYPEKDIAELGAAVYPVAVYRAGDLRNTIETGISKMWDASGQGRHLYQALSSRQPTVSTSTLANGLSIRKAVFDGASGGSGSADIVTGSLAFPLSQAGGFGCLAAVSAVINGTKAIASESSSSSDLPLGLHLLGNASGDLTVLYRDANDNIPGPLMFPVLQTGAWNGVTNFIAIRDTRTEVQGQVNGNVGTAVTYARGAGPYTTNLMSIGGVQQASNDPSFSSPVTVGIIWYTNTAPDLAYLTKARAFTQYRYGTV